MIRQTDLLCIFSFPFLFPPFHWSCLLWLGLGWAACGQTTEPPAAPPELIIYEDFEQLTPWLETDSDTTYVVNFWATWCKPCVEELPYFQEFRSKYRDRPVKLLLISLDFPNQLDSKLKPFLEQKQLQAQVIALTDVDFNSWIDRVSPKWSGAIPATLVFNKKETRFFEQSFHSLEELEEAVEPLFLFHH